VVVVSAMSGTSGAVEELMREVNADAPPASRALALASADQLSAALFAIALAGLGVTTRLLGPSQAGLTGTGYATQARLARCDGEPVRKALRKHQVVVVPGGHGTDDTGNPVMFGRNSSDLTAVAIATAIEAAGCEIFSDVPGIYTADPALVPDARPISRASYRFAGEITEGGAKVLHPDAVMLARLHDLSVVFRGKPPGAPSLTTMNRSGNWQPAVAAHGRGRVWSFPDYAEARSAQDALMDEGFDALQSGHCLVIDPAIPGSALTRACSRGSETDLRLITVLQGENERPQRHLVPVAELGLAVREHHRRLYPDDGEAVREPTSEEASDGAGEDAGEAAGDAPDGQPETARQPEPARPAEVVRARSPYSRVMMGRSSADSLP
jgi:aspartate kinase